MQPNPEFKKLPKEFWANVRTISQAVGYTLRPPRRSGVPGEAGPVHVPTLAEIMAAFEELDLSCRHLISSNAKPTSLGKKVLSYFDYRADALNNTVRSLLMNSEEAEALFHKLRRQLKSDRFVPLNKQSAEKKRPAFLTGMVNMLIESQLRGLPCDYNPQQLTTFTRNNAPFRTLARRIDGAFPGPVNPIAIWEVKEYYYTTTFGSRVADGVYETLLDGMEIEDVREASANVDDQSAMRGFQHVLVIDAYFTWWVKGRSYLCRILDMLHMGYVDEVIFGREVERRLPELADGWVKTYHHRRSPRT